MQSTVDYKWHGSLNSESPGERHLSVSLCTSIQHEMMLSAMTARSLLNPHFNP